LRPIIGESTSTVDPHILIIRVHSILAVGAIVEVVLGHPRLVIAGSVEAKEIFRIVGKKSGGLLKQRRMSSYSEVPRAFQLNHTKGLILLAAIGTVG